MSDTTNDICIFEGCDKVREGAKYCHGHRAQAKRGAELRPLRKRATKGSPLCTFSGCDKGHSGNGLCHAHNYQQRHGKELTPLRKKATKASGKRFCGRVECTRVVRALDLCASHYTQYRRNGDTFPLGTWEKPSKGVCDFDGCIRKHYAKGLCYQHYKAKREGRELKPIRVDQKPQD